MNVPQPLAVIVGGVKWNLFSADYTTPDGTYSFYFYAISFDHASLILHDIKETAVLSGQVIEIIPPTTARNEKD